jgi:hypothetical protein
MAQILENVSSIYEDLKVGASEYGLISKNFKILSKSSHLSTLFDCIKLINTFIVGPILDNYPLMKTPLPTLSILLCYWVFVFYAGPRFMKNRKAFDLNKAIIAYNLYQILFSSWLLLSVSFH